MAFARYISSTFSIRPVIFENADQALDVYSYYDKILLAGDFNAEIYGHHLETLLGNSLLSC